MELENTRASQAPITLARTVMETALNVRFLTETVLIVPILFSFSQTASVVSATSVLTGISKTLLREFALLAWIVVSPVSMPTLASLVGFLYLENLSTSMQILTPVSKNVETAATKKLTTLVTDAQLAVLLVSTQDWRAATLAMEISTKTLIPRPVLQIPVPMASLSKLVFPTSAFTATQSV